MDHGVTDFDSGGEAIEDQAAGFLLEDLDEFAVGGKVGFIAKDGCGQVAFEGASGVEVVACGVAVDEERIGAEDLVSEVWLANQLIERNTEQRCSGVERHRTGAAAGEEMRLGCNGGAGCAI